MDDARRRARRSFLGRRVPPAFDVRVVTLAPGGERAYDDAEWWDAIVAVERGELELECLGGGRRSFERGSVLWLDGLPLRALRNSGREPVLLVAVSRRSDESGGDSVSTRATVLPRQGRFDESSRT